MLVALNRSSYRWDYIVLRTFTPVDWMENFRVSGNFSLFTLEVISCKSTKLHNTIPVNKRIIITLWCLDTCSECRTIVQLFGIARCTVCLIVHDTYKAFISTLQKTFIKFPSGEEELKTGEEELKIAADHCKSKLGMVQCIGSIDGCHIPITLLLSTIRIITTEKDDTLLFFRLLLILATCSVMCVWMARQYT